MRLWQQTVGMKCWWKEFSEAQEGTWKTDEKTAGLRLSPGESRAPPVLTPVPPRLDLVTLKPGLRRRAGSLTGFGCGTPFFRILQKATRKKKIPKNGSEKMSALIGK